MTANDYLEEIMTNLQSEYSLSRFSILKVKKKRRKKIF